MIDIKALNADVGEGTGFDSQIIPLVGSINICCGAHAGGVAEMHKAVDLALQHQVRIGAHPGYPDRENFGRQEMNLSVSELEETLYNQLSSLEGIIREKGGELSYIKPHGALYNQMAKDYNYALEVLEILQGIQSVPFMLLANSQAVEAAKDLGLDVISEGFLDRRYTEDGLLVSRTKPGALISEPDLACAQAEALLNGTPFESLSGQELALRVDSICVHADTANAVNLLTSLTI